MKNKIYKIYELINLETLETQIIIKSIEEKTILKLNI